MQDYRNIEARKTNITQINESITTYRSIKNTNQSGFYSRAKHYENMLLQEPTPTQPIRDRHSCAMKPMWTNVLHQQNQTRFLLNFAVVEIQRLIARYAAIGDNDLSAINAADREPATPLTPVWRVEAAD